MLAEFAFTPSVFDENAHESKEAWHNELRELAQTMFHQLSPSPIMVSNLYDGSWYKEAERTVKDIADHRVRPDCEKLLAQLRQSLVFRPHYNDWPNNDFEWGREAVESAAREPIERIITSREAYEKLTADSCHVRCISDVRDKTTGFWNAITASGTVPMQIDDQVDLLHKICVHSDFLCVVTPHIHGGDDDETDFAIAIIERAFKRPEGYHAVSIDIHTEGPSGQPGSDEFAKSLKSKASNIERRIRNVLSSGQMVKVFFWPRLLHRYVVGGIHAEMPGGKIERGVRWGVALHHFARRNDDPNLPRSPWNLLNKQDLIDLFDKYLGAGATGYLDPSPIQIKA